MVDGTTPDVANYLISQGVLGVVVLMFAGVIAKLWSDYKALLKQMNEDKEKYLNLLSDFKLSNAVDSQTLASIKDMLEKLLDGQQQSRRRS